MEAPTSILIAEYNPDWVSTFAQLRLVYEQHLSGLVQQIEHIGSTSVVGLAAKPILDIDLIVEDNTTLQQVVEKLSHLGYQHQGDAGIPEREAFRRISDNTPLVTPVRVWPPHHLYVCLAGSTPLRNHLLLRDYLRAHPEKAAQYGELKKKLATLFPSDIDQYVAGKTPFITSILKEAGLTQPEIDQITGQNKAKQTLRPISR